jgi:hypothetical protein
MARERREVPRGLIAPLSQSQLGSLRSIAEGTLKTPPAGHGERLLHLELIEVTPEGFAVTALGRQRLVSDR